MKIALNYLPFEKQSINQAVEYLWSSEPRFLSYNQKISLLHYNNFLISNFLKEKRYESHGNEGDLEFRRLALIIQ